MYTNDLSILVTIFSIGIWGRMIFYIYTWEAARTNKSNMPF